MSDIIEKLKGEQGEARYRGNADLHSMLVEATAEIERLRAALADGDALRAEREKCADMIDRLRANVPIPRSYELAHYCMGLEAAAMEIRPYETEEAQNLTLLKGGAGDE